MTNIAIVHYSHKDFSDREALNELLELFQLIGRTDKDIHTILIIRDTIKSDIFKGDLKDFVNIKNE